MTTRCGRFQCLFLAAILAMGAGLAWGFLGGMLVAAVETVLRPVNTYWQCEDLVIMRDGTPIIQSNKHYEANTILFRTLDGKQYDKSVLQAESSCYLPGPLSSHGRFRPMAWSERVARAAGGSNEAIWYFVHDGSLHGHGYFVGYDNESRLRIGFIGRAGSRPDEPPVTDQFLVDGRRMVSRQAILNLNLQDKAEEDWSWSGESNITGRVFLLADDGPVLIDLANRSARVVLKDSNSISASSISGTLVVRTPDRIRILQPDGKEVRSYPLPAPLRGNDAITLWGLAKKKVVLCVRSDYPTRTRNVYWLDSDGRIARHEQVSLRDRGQPPWISPPVENLILSVVAIPSPGTIMAGLGFDAWQRASTDMAGRLRDLWPNWWPGLLGAALISTVLAVCCYRRQRRYALPWPGVWAVFVLLFGVPAYLGYMVHRLWPARLPCPKCGRLAPRDRPACAVCRQDFPAPARKGIEVFA
jgi:hypothetical protein